MQKILLALAATTLLGGVSLTYIQARAYDKATQQGSNP